ncbi:ribosome maturation factor RimM [Thermosulfurimonas marina]|uniref:ribosome maturation factor RimM n=1 Tax=Thermosulfurimonas marina TaxID=2047767 RepID=UPI00144A8199|nr:ribosome maturation factor RimM [Thermosulfurimonas marina]
MGRVARPHGLKGEVRVQPFLSNRDLLRHIPRFFLSREGPERLIPERVREAPGGRDLLFFFQGVTSYEEAEALRGRVLYAETADFPPPEEGEFYYFQLEGLPVREESGRLLGRVVGVMPVGPYDLLEVETPEGRSFYLPLVEEVVLSVNLQEGYLLVRPSPGLIEVQLGEDRE